MDLIDRSIIDAALQAGVPKDQLARAILADYIASRPGRGHMAGNRVPRPAFKFTSPEATNAIIESWLNHPTKLNDYIGWYPQEFRYLEVILEPAMTAAGGIRGPAFRQCKLSCRSRIVIFLAFYAGNTSLSKAEREFQ
jgi:hypothetical protein